MPDLRQEFSDVLKSHEERIHKLQQEIRISQADDEWRSARMLNEWERYTTTWSEPAFRKDSRGFVHCKGVQKNGTLDLPSMSIPLGYEPPAVLYAFTTSSSEPSGAFVMPGKEKFQRSHGVVCPFLGSTSWFSVDGNLWDITDDDWHHVGESGEPQFLKGWSNKRADVLGVRENAGFKVDNRGFLYLKGTVLGGPVEDFSPVFRLPKEFRPDKNHVFAGHGFSAVRVDVQSNGLVLVHPHPENTRYSFHSPPIPLNTKDWKKLTLQNGWVDHSEDYQSAKYFKDDEGWVYTCGVIKDGTTTDSTIFAKLPEGYQSGEGIIYGGVDGTNSHYRMDIDKSTGNMKLRSVSNNTLLSLLGCYYVAEHEV